jgi:hypothetical protein
MTWNLSTSLTNRLVIDAIHIFGPSDELSWGVMASPTTQGLPKILKEAFYPRGKLVLRIDLAETG